MARFAVVAVLSIGLLVFGFYAINDLTQGMKPPAPIEAPDMLALGEGAPPPMQGSFIEARNADEALSPQYIPLDHDPGHFPAYPGARRDICKRLPDGNGYADEQARYVAVSATVEQVLEHYRNAMQTAGFTANAPRPFRGQPNSSSIHFTLEQKNFIIGAVQRDVGPPPRPPRLPNDPEVSITVQFRYPIAPAP